MPYTAKRMIMKKIVMLIALICGTFTAFAQENAKQSHFTWGIDLGSSIDMRGEEMTNINLDAFFGYKNDYFKVLGIGAELDIMTGNSSRSIPVYAIMRTSFLPGQHQLFGDFRAGISMNDVYDFKSQTGAYASAGLGITLAKGSTFRSHLIVGYTFIGRSDFDLADGVYHCPDLHFATLRLGISF